MARDGGAGREREARASVLGAVVHEGVKAGANAPPELVGRAQVAGKVRELMDGGEAGRRMRASVEHVGREGARGHRRVGLWTSCSGATTTTVGATTGARE
jgi:hypothetical protein